MFHKSNKNFVSPEDEFIADIRDKFAETLSQREERIKHERIARRRDLNYDREDDSLPWEDF